MAFWLEREWQCEAAREIGSRFAETGPSFVGMGGGESTREVMRVMADLAPRLCRREVGKPLCSFGGGEAREHRKAWLYDFCCWLADAEENSIGLPIVAESEWGGWSEVLDDFEKLVQARAGIRVLFFDHRVAPNGWFDALMTRANQFQPNDANDAWLFVYWVGGGFEFKSNLLE